MNHSKSAELGGIACILGATACFSLIDTVAQFVILSVPAIMALWVRYVVQAVATTAVLVPMHGRDLFRTGKPLIQLLRGVLVIISTTLAFYSLKVVQVGEFTAILMVTPMLVTFLAVTLLGERIHPRQWLFVIGGFIGMLLIVRPGMTGMDLGGRMGDGMGWAALLPISCLLTSSMFQLLSSHLGRTEKPATTHFYSSWIGLVCASVIVPSHWTSIGSVSLWGLMGVMGIFGAIGHFVLSTAYQRAPASSLMPYLYAQVGFAVLGGYLVFDHVPDLLASTGIVIITLSGIANTWYAIRKNRQNRKARPQAI